MFKKKKKKKNNSKKREKKFDLPGETKQMILGVLMVLAAVIISLSFFGKAGQAGDLFVKASRFLIGETVFLTPLVFLLAGFAFLTSKADALLPKEKKVIWPVVLAIILVLLGSTGIMGALSPQEKTGGWTGYLLSWPLLKYFGFWATLLIFSAAIVIGILIFWQFIPHIRKEKEKQEEKQEEEKKPSIVKKIFTPKFKVKEIAPLEKEAMKKEKPEPKPEPKPVTNSGKKFNYNPPPLTLLSQDKGAPSSGDTKVNSAIIKKTLQNFGIDVTMSEINIGPTVTQYTLKPSEGVKLSKITGLANDLALALASHPLRIEAPIPGRSLVGIEVPNSGRAEVRLRKLLENDQFQKKESGLVIGLGRDVSGSAIFSDLTKMPHMLVAGSTGSGKTIFLNTLILSLLYQPSTSLKSAGPENLRFILVDPKRVEFSVYENLPHLLCPVIYDANKTINALKWLTGEMERRFDVLSEVHSRNITSYNDYALKNDKEPLPYIVLIIDELADLMAAKGREIEGAIVRLAQMARAVGIHLVVATQRPSVEVITGLIKANITSRITFQVASQVDSRTVIDTSGAERLLGSGDMLYVSAEFGKPKRIQGAYVSEKEVKKVIEHIIKNTEKPEIKTEMETQLIMELEKPVEDEQGVTSYTDQDDDPLFEDAKNVVFEANKASASLLQRRLRVGYARAARLIDMLEDKGIVGPQEGSKAREVYKEAAGEEDEEGWQKV